MTQFLIGIAKVLPKQKLVPQKDLAHLAFRDEIKRNLVRLISCFITITPNDIDHALSFNITNSPGKVQCD